MDNLNTHHPSSLYEEFEPAEARRIAERLEIHYTPKQLDMAEIEIGVMVPIGPAHTGPKRCGGRWERGRLSANERMRASN